MGKQVAARINKKQAEKLHIYTDVSGWTGDEHPAEEEGCINPVSREVLFLIAGFTSDLRSKAQVFGFK